MSLAGRRGGARGLSRARAAPIAHFEGTSRDAVRFGTSSRHDTRRITRRKTPRSLPRRTRSPRRISRCSRSSSLSRRSRSRRSSPSSRRSSSITSTRNSLSTRRAPTRRTPGFREQVRGGFGERAGGGISFLAPQRGGGQRESPLPNVAGAGRVDAHREGGAILASGGPARHSRTGEATALAVRSRKRRTFLSSPFSWELCLVSERRFSWSTST